MSDPDLSQLLADWPHEPGRINARRIDGRDGRPKIQVRIDLGVLQMEWNGRPDGVRPDDFDTLLALHRERLDRYARQAGTPAGFVLSAEDCRRLREEAVQFYHRYVALFAMGEYERVRLDTAHNLALFDLCRDFGATEQDRGLLEQFRPHVITMRSRAEAELAVAERQPKAALAALDHGLDELRAYYADVGRPDAFEGANEVQLLRGMRDALVPKLPSSQRVELEERLRAAIDAENYELAAILRDELRLL